MFDNGREFTDYQRISHVLKTPVYFARPYHSCGPPVRERGLNENTNAGPPAWIDPAVHSLELSN